MHKTECVYENKINKIIKVFEIQRDFSIPTRKPSLALIKRKRIL